MPRSHHILFGIFRNKSSICWMMTGFLKKSLKSYLGKSFAPLVFVQSSLRSQCSSSYRQISFLQQFWEPEVLRLEHFPQVLAAQHFQKDGIFSFPVCLLLRKWNLHHRYFSFDSVLILSLMNDCLALNFVGLIVLSFYLNATHDLTLLTSWSHFLIPVS